MHSSPNRFRNAELEAKTAALQAEFDALLKQGVGANTCVRQSPTRDNYNAE